MDSTPRPKDTEAPNPVDACRFRLPLVNRPDADWSRCDLLRQLLPELADESWVVPRSACAACCQTFPPSAAVWNPVIASLVLHNLTQTRAQCPVADRAERVRRAERALDFDRAHAVRGTEADPISRAPLIRLGLRDAVALPRQRCGPPIESWAVGVTTAPRRRPTLERCLDSLSAAGWRAPHLFVDGSIRIPERYRDLPATWRNPPVGAWPNFYLALAELLLREPLADAFLLVQDDACFYAGENLREYLTDVLWPGSTPGIVSLYWSASPTAPPASGWQRALGRWRCGAVALIVPRSVVLSFLQDDQVQAHRWSSREDGRTGIPDVLESWANCHAITLSYPSLSLVEHIGTTSAIWSGPDELTRDRRATCFVGDVLNQAAMATEGPTPSSGMDRAGLLLDRAAAGFPEDDFPPRASSRTQYESEVAAGRRRMQHSSAVLAAIGRDIAPMLPATAARMEQLATMFGECHMVIFENDSRDRTASWLKRWAAANPRVRVISHRFHERGFGQETGEDRTACMAYFRNQCRAAVLAEFPHYDFVVSLDMDLEGGWSYEGIAQTFSRADWDFVGSNGLWCEPQREPVHYDAFAFREVGSRGAGDFVRINRLVFRRGDPWVPVWSCFGGLGIYRMECWSGAVYHGHDCEHVTLHDGMRRLGFDRLFLNPSQIVLYTPDPGRRSNSPAATT